MSEYRLTDEQWGALREAAPGAIPINIVARELEFRRGDVDAVLTLVQDVLGLYAHNREPLTDEEWERMPGDRHGCLRWFSSGGNGEGFWLSRNNLNTLRHFGVTVEPPPAKPEPRYVIEHHENWSSVWELPQSWLVAKFYGDNHQKRAEAEAARLNEENR
jgi:hypothetical protein